MNNKPYNDGDGLSNIEIMAKAKKSKLTNFKCVMRDELNNKKPLNKECGILNLDSSQNDGSHWTCWFKDGDNKYYFDSFGVNPPKELIKYLKSPILCSTYQLQQYNDTNCGEWCLNILNKLNKGDDFTSTITNFVK